jgi:DNA (cytosine-5)-methyltransferase 1
MVVDDVRKVTGAQLLEAGRVGDRLDLLKACPPCQGFSSLRGNREPDAARNDLVLDTLRLVRELAPRAVLLENVPGLRRDGRFGVLLDGMRQLGYAMTDYVVEASSLGVPQRRRRLVVVAVHGASSVPATVEALLPLAARRPGMTAGTALAGLAAAQAPDDPSHVWRRTRGTVAERIEAIPVGGTRFDLPDHLQLECHRRLRTKDGRVNRSATGSYGRVRLDEPAPTMTTRCTTPACGAFIHPTEHRGLSLREAATLQTFPATYRWYGGYDSVERQIGNAVPVWMAEALGRAVLRLLDGHDVDDALLALHPTASADDRKHRRVSGLGSRPPGSRTSA